MTPRQLRYFISTAEQGSFAAAARVLFIAQPSLSQQIGKLEQELGVTLFLRKPRGVALTESGKKLLDHAHAILRHIDAARADVMATAENPVGTVKLGLTQAACNLLPLHLMEAASLHYPGITLDINAGLTSNLRQWLHEGAMDIAVFPVEPSDREAFQLRPLISETLFFVSAAKPHDLPLRGRGKHRCIRFADLAPYEFILPSSSRDGLGRLVTELEQETGVHLKKRPGLGQLMTNLSFVLAGNCECLLPWTAIHHMVEIGLLTAVPVVEPEIQRDVFIATPIDKPMTVAVERTVELIETCTAKVQAMGKWRGHLLYQP